MSFVVLLLLSGILSPIKAWPSVPWPCSEFAYGPSTFVLEKDGVYLFRGPSPVGKNHSAFENSTLFECFSTLAPSFPRYDAGLFIISLLAPQYVESEAADLLIELDWTSNYTQRSRLIHWALYGDDPNTDPETLPQREREKLAKSLASWQPDNLVRRVPILSRILNTVKITDFAHFKAVALYIHCTGGIDRTGEIVGALMMRDFGWTYHRTVAWNTAIGSRQQGPREHLALKWYCFYLFYQLDYELNCEDDPSDSAFF